MSVVEGGVVSSGNETVPGGCNGGDTGGKASIANFSAKSGGGFRKSASMELTPSSELSSQVVVAVVAFGDEAEIAFLDLLLPFVSDPIEYEFNFRK
jgi:hypothetical protein